MMGALFAAGVDPAALQDVHITVRARFLGLCSVIMNDAFTVGPCFKDIDGGVYMLTAGAESSSIDSFVELVRLDRQPTPYDLPPLLRFGKSTGPMVSVPAADIAAMRADIASMRSELSDISMFLGPG